MPCPAMVRHCQTLWHSEGRSGHTPLQVLCLPRGLPQIPGTVLPGVGPQGWGCCAELSHLDHPSGGHACVHIAWSSCASISSCVWGCSCSHTSPAHAHQLFVFLCRLHSVLLACWPWAQLLPVFLPAGSHTAFSSTGGLSQPKAQFNRLPLVGLGWARCPAAWEVCTMAATVTAVGWSIPLLQTPLARLGSASQLCLGWHWLASDSMLLHAPLASSYSWFAPLCPCSLGPAQVPHSPSHPWPGCPSDPSSQWDWPSWAVLM